MKKIIGLVFLVATLVLGLVGSRGVMGEEEEAISERIKILEEKRTVQFLDEKGKMIKELKLKKMELFQLSGGKKVIAIHNPLYQYHEITVFDEKGETIKKCRALPYGGLSIADDGSFIVYGWKASPSIPYIAGVAFYSSEGRLVKKIDLKNGHCIGRHFYDNYFLLLRHGRYDKDEESMRVHLICHDKNGNEIWEYIFEKISQWGINVSPELPMELIDNLQKIKIRLYSKKERSKMTWVFDKDGKLLSRQKGW